LHDALRRACSATQTALEEDLERPHLPEVEDRVNELAAFLDADEDDNAAQLADSTWLLVLSHLAPEEQRALQDSYEALARGTGAAIEYGERREGQADWLMQTLAPVEQLLAELPYTTLEPSGRDDYELRRRALSVEVVWADRDSKDAESGGPLYITWCDGYQTTVATMTAGLFQGTLCWTLDITDPAPGRSAERVLPGSSEDVRTAARDDLQAALEWAANELGDRYVIRRLS